MILLIDKPKGITSFGVIREMRHKTGIKKIGHAGTLDPLATGLLILATDKDTKKINQFMGLSKVYEAEVTFGAKSTTYDAEGEITQCQLPDSVTDFESDLKKALKSFEGEIDQMPPVFSALKIKGKRACDLVRKGKLKELPGSKRRKVNIMEFELLDLKFPIAKFRIHCSKGTYIRSLAHDLGEKLKVGAYLSGLRRTQIGEYRVEDARKVDNY